MIQMRKLIGVGTFTKAYQVEENKVEVISSCPAKEAYALFCGENPFAPKIEKDYSRKNTYLMPLYPKIKAPKQQLNERAYEIYKALRKLPLGLNYYGFERAIENLTVLHEEERENILGLAGDVGNAISPEDMRFEISPRNISHDKKGNLILLDCFFSAKLLREVWSRL